VTILKSWQKYSAIKNKRPTSLETSGKIPATWNVFISASESLLIMLEVPFKFVCNLYAQHTTVG